MALDTSQVTVQNVRDHYHTDLSRLKTDFPIEVALESAEEELEDIPEGSLSERQSFLIKLNLACHYLQASIPQSTRDASEGGASATYDIDTTDYRSQAIDRDPTGTLGETVGEVEAVDITTRDDEVTAYERSRW